MPLNVIGGLIPAHPLLAKYQVGVITCVVVNRATFATIEDVDAIAADQGVVVVVCILGGVENDAAQFAREVVVAALPFDAVIADQAEGEGDVATKNEFVVKVSGLDP